MKLWIDAATLSSERVFGMTLIERHLKAARHQKVALMEVIVDTGDKPVSSVTLPDDRGGLACPVRVVSHSGDIATRIAASAAGDVVLATTATSLIDARLYGFLAKQEHDLAVADDGAVLARLSTTWLDPEMTDLARALNNNLPWLSQAEFPSFVPKLRRNTPFYLFSVTTPEHRKKIERFLFWSNYKGSTDFFTKYVYPPLVWLLVPPLARARIHPNVVTIISIILTFAAVPLFATGYFFWGFVCAYSMSVLDSVDGKLARVTFTDSAIGNILDHGLDLVHPPFWYCAWAWGLSGGDWHAPVFTASLWMLGLYILDRLILKIYPTVFGRGLHTHAKMDALVRTFISRRNINLPLFTVGYPLGFGVQTIYLIVVWQALTCVYHGLRTFWILAVEKAKPDAVPAR